MSEESENHIGSPAGNLTPERQAPESLLTLRRAKGL